MCVPPSSPLSICPEVSQGHYVQQACVVVVNRENKDILKSKIASGTPWSTRCPSDWMGRRPSPQYSDNDWNDAGRFSRRSFLVKPRPLTVRNCHEKAPCAACVRARQQWAKERERKRAWTKTPGSVRVRFRVLPAIWRKKALLFRSGHEN